MAMYPNYPGHTDDDTSMEAAATISASTLRNKVLGLLKARSRTVHESARDLAVGISSIQPRFSELRARGRIKDTGERRTNPTSGKRAIVWGVK